MEHDQDNDGWFMVIVIAGGVVVLLLLLGGAFFLFARGSAPEDYGPDTQPTPIAVPHVEGEAPQRHPAPKDDPGEPQPMPRTTKAKGP